MSEEAKESYHTCQHCHFFEEKGILMKHHEAGHICYGVSIGICKISNQKSFSLREHVFSKSGEMVFSDNTCQEWEEKL